MKDPRSIIFAPVVSEKTYELIENQNIYTFVVDRGTNKTEIKQAVTAVFGVKVERVNTINRKGKVKRTGAHLGKRKDVKHALVKLAAGESIEIFGV